MKLSNKLIIIFISFTFILSCKNTTTQPPIKHETIELSKAIDSLKNIGLINSSKQTWNFSDLTQDANNLIIPATKNDAGSYLFGLETTVKNKVREALKDFYYEVDFEQKENNAIENQNKEPFYMKLIFKDRRTGNIVVDDYNYGQGIILNFTPTANWVATPELSLEDISSYLATIGNLKIKDKFDMNFANVKMEKINKSGYSYAATITITGNTGDEIKREAEIRQPLETKMSSLSDNIVKFKSIEEDNEGIDDVKTLMQWRIKFTSMKENTISNGDILLIVKLSGNITYPNRDFSSFGTTFVPESITLPEPASELQFNVNLRAEPNINFTPEIAEVKILKNDDNPIAADSDIPASDVTIERKDQSKPEEFTVTLKTTAVTKLKNSIANEGKKLRVKIRAAYPGYNPKTVDVTIPFK